MYRKYLFIIISLKKYLSRDTIPYYFYLEVWAGLVGSTSFGHPPSLLNINMHSRELPVEIFAFIAEKG